MLKLPRRNVSAWISPLMFTGLHEDLDDADEALGRIDGEVLPAIFVKPTLPGFARYIISGRSPMSSFAGVKMTSGTRNMARASTRGPLVGSAF